MPIQQTHSDLNSAPQKLSKIETLRLARNYIFAMAQTLQEGRPMELQRFIKILSKDLSQTTANLLTGTLMGNGNHLPHRRLFASESSDSNSTGFNDVYYSNGDNFPTQSYVGNNYYNSYWQNYRYECDNNNNGRTMNSFRYWDNSYGFNEPSLYNVY